MSRSVCNSSMLRSIFLRNAARYHINADTAYALRKYVEVSGNTDFLHRFGAEILVETARFW